MYGRQSKSPTWFVVITGVLLVFGGYFIWRGFLFWADANFSFTPPTATISSDSDASGANKSGTKFTILDLTKTVAATASPTSVCQQFRVKVLRARVRECAKDTCNTISLPEQGAVFCVLRVAPDATDWYVVNLKPDDPIGQIGYMSSSVLVPVNPTPKPSPTLNLATVTVVPSATSAPSSTPPPTNTPNPAAPPTQTQLPTKTPPPPFVTA